MRVEETHDLATCHAIRRIVFIEGQAVAEHEEVDGEDEACLQFLLWLGDTAIGTLRVKALPERRAKLQRVAVLPDHRGKGAGAFLMQQVMEVLRARGFLSVTLGSQVHAIPFYDRLGFEVYGPEYDDAGIPHRDMQRAL